MLCEMGTSCTCEMYRTISAWAVSTGWQGPTCLAVFIISACQRTIQHCDSVDCLPMVIMDLYLSDALLVDGSIMHHEDALSPLLSEHGLHSIVVSGLDCYVCPGIVHSFKHLKSVFRNCI